MVEFNEGEGREPWVTRLGLVAFYPTLIAAVAGGVLLVAPARVPRAVGAVRARSSRSRSARALTYGQTRFRAAAEPSLAVLAAVALVALFRRIRPAPVPMPSPE